jgi:molybdopterin converting factor small subunit
MITVSYFGQIKQAAGIATESVALGDSNCIGSFLRDLNVVHGPDFRAHIENHDGGFSRVLLVFVDGRQILEWSDAPLLDGANLQLVTPISGG